jgi:putative hemolysin
VDPFSVLLFLILLALSAFFSGTEIAFLNTSKHTIQWLIREKRFGAKSLERVKSDMDRLLITIMIGNNLVNVALTAIGTVASISLAQELRLPDEYGLIIATGVVTLILLLFWDITPKTIFARYSTPISLAVAPLYRFLIPLFFPLSFFLDLFVKWFARLIGASNYTTRISYAEVNAFIDISHEEWDLQADERRQIKNLLSLSEMTAESVMTPRVNVEFLSLSMTVDQACEFLMKASHSRIPIYGASTDDIDYVLTFREAFKLQRDGHGLARLDALDLEKIMKIPLTQPLDDLFEKFQKSRRHIALVLDEHGWTAGVVTMEDVLEEVFGDIKDEKDKEEIYMKKKSSTKIEAIGTVLIDDILEEWNLSPQDIDLLPAYEGESLSYIFLAETEEFPSVGTEIVLGSSGPKVTLRILDVDETVIQKIECEKK